MKRAFAIGHRSEAAEIDEACKLVDGFEYVTDMDRKNCSESANNERNKFLFWKLTF
jgi:hypothetical protein